MLLPSVFGTRFMDNWDLDAKDATLRTDIVDAGDHYEFVTDLPGYKKEDIKAKLDRGVLTINASRHTETEDKDEQGRYLRRERYTGTCQRSFYVGDHLTQDDIKAKFAEGVLKVEVPKETAKAIEENRYIAIEG